MKGYQACCRWVVSFLMLLLSASVVLSSEEGTGIIYGKDHAFMISAPKGWVLDNQCGQDKGLWAVLYPTGSSWSSGTVVMYVNTASKTVDSTLDDLIAGDLARQRQQSPNLHVSPGDPLPIADGSLARVNYLSGDKWGNYESIAYVEAPTVYVMIVLTSRVEAAYKHAQLAFADLVKSYRFLTKDVNIKKQQ